MDQGKSRKIVFGCVHNAQYLCNTTLTYYPKSADSVHKQRKMRMMSTTNHHTLVLLAVLLFDGLALSTDWLESKLSL